MYTVSLRKAYREAEYYVRKVNYEIRASGLFVRLGKNMLWVEVHVLRAGEDNNKIEVNISKPMVPSTEIQSFVPQIHSLRPIPTDIQYASMSRTNKKKESAVSIQKSMRMDKDKEVDVEMDEDRLKMIDEEMKMVNRL